MRCLMFALAVVCAILSGWTSAVAQAHAQGAAATAGERTAPSVAHRHGGHDAQAAAAHQETHDPSRRTGGCAPGGKCLHPMLCAACFAVQVTAQGIEHGATARTTILPLVDLPLVSTAPEPVSPPPKTRLSIG